MDEEMRVEVASGTVVVATAQCSMCSGPALALVLRSLSFNVNMEVCLVKRVAGMDVPVVAVPSRLIECHQEVTRLLLNDGTCAEQEERHLDVVGVRLRFDHSAMWRMRTVFFEISGILPEKWSVRVE